MLRKLWKCFKDQLGDTSDRTREYRIYKDVEDIIHQGCWELNLKDNTLWWSDEVYHIFGTSRSDFTPSYEALLELIHPDDRDGLNHAYQYSVENHKPYEYKHRILTPEGKVRYVIEKGKTLYDRHGRPEKSIGTVLDITTLQNLEDQVRLARKMESLGLLAGGIAHDFNNLIGVIMGYTSMLIERTAAMPEIHSDILEIQKAARKSSEITSQLLAFSKSNTIDPVVVNVNERIISLQNIIRQLTRDDIRVTYNLCVEGCSVLIGLAEFDQIIINLVSNAAHALPDGGKISIETRLARDDSLRDWMHLTVSDDGYGIAPEYQPRIFEPFFTTKSKSASSGLGLATVFNIVSKRAGSISFTSEPGAGTSFLISFPVCKDCGLMLSCQDCLFQHDIGRQIPMSDVTVLLVEDDELMRNLIENMLRAIGCKVRVYSSAEQALAWYRTNNHSIDIVISDVIMPGLNGPALIQRLKEINPSTRALFISGYTAQTIRRYNITLDHDHFLAKPFSVHSLRERVSTILNIRHA